MARVSTYLNFPGTTKEAFNFYKIVFGTEFIGSMMRMGEVPPQEGTPPLKEEDKNLVMHVSMPILGGHIISGTDALESHGHKWIPGNNMHLTLEPDSKEETERLYNALSEGGTIEMPLQNMFWGSLYGSWTDKYGIRWMINYTETK
jgi:PhnB protein